MPASNNEASAGPVVAQVCLPAGVRHYQTSGTAESWAAWDALTDGWTERSWHYDPQTSSQCDPAAPGAKLHRQKSTRIDGHNIVVWPPHEPREQS